MTYANMADRNAIQDEQPWDERDLPKTTFELLTRTADAHGPRNAVSFQLQSGPKDPCETYSWDQEAEQIAAILRETGAKVLVTMKSFPKSDVAQKAAEAIAMAPNVETVLEVDLLRYLTGLKKFIVPLIRPKNPVTHKARVLQFMPELEKQPTTLAFEDSKKDRVACYFHTGGTTGMPKVVQHKYSGIVYNAWLGARLLFTENDVQICPLPLFHVCRYQQLASCLLWLGSTAARALPPVRGSSRRDDLRRLRPDRSDLPCVHQPARR